MSGFSHTSTGRGDGARRGSGRGRGLAAVLCSIAVLLAAAPAAAGPGSGTAAIAPPADVPAGSIGTWIITYTAAEPFSGGMIRVVIPNPWTAPQIVSGTAAGYVTASSEGTLEAVPVTINGRNINVHIDTLSTDQTVTVVYGDDGLSPDARAQAPVDLGTYAFTTSSDPLDGSPDPIGSSPSLEVVPAEISKLLFTTAERTASADGESAVMRIQSRDEFDHPSPVASDQVVTLSSASGTGTFSRLPAGGWISTATVTIAAGTDTVSFYYRDTTPGTYQIAASADGQTWTDALQQVFVEAGDPEKLAVTPADTTVTAGDYARFLVRVTDIVGNQVAVPVAQTVSLIGSGSFFDPGDHGTPVTQATIEAGSSSVEVDYRNVAKNLFPGYTLYFYDGDGISPSLGIAPVTIYVDNAAADLAASTVAASPPSATADGVASIGITVTVTDQFGNGVDGETVLIGATGADNDFTQPAGQTNATGVATGSIRSTKAEQKIVSATIGAGLITDTETVTFTAGPADLAATTIESDRDTVTADGVDEATVAVTVLDAYDNPVSGATVVLTATGTGTSITQPSSVTGADGIAVGTVRSTTAQLKTIGALVNTQTIAATEAVLFVPGGFDPLESGIAGDKSTATADGIDAVTVTVTVRDAQSNP
ncbi:MAG: invasin domain 3-containing protein, partial [Candidatus Krumholzibacteria bacterium]|nr:invasin domain 3-containing protein [Candidatus Krumholzibacteria bacterium]